MKNFKSLILGSAAGMLAVAGAQAADLPVKAKPVEYVKVCSAYGAGFYYIPGTDICLRVGGFIYSEFGINERAHGNNSTVGARNRGDDWSTWRIRQGTIFDARSNTEYGTLRAYFNAGFQWDTNAAGVGQSQSIDGGNWTWYYSAAFIQFAGFTFGMANSFFAFDGSNFMTAVPGYSGSKSSPMIAYTAQLGSGISATISMEDATIYRNAIEYSGTVGGLAAGGSAYAGEYMPDFIANLRVDQAWGDAQVSAAIHQVKTATSGGVAELVPQKYGYAFLGGLNFKLPQIGAGDNLQVSGAWAKGAIEYTQASASNYISNRANMSYSLNGNGYPFVNLFDSWVSGGTQQLVTSRSLDVEFRHFWTPTLRSSIGYIWFDFDAGSVANSQVQPDGSNGTVLANLIWSPVKNLDLGTEVYWSDMKAKNATGAGSSSANGSQSWWGGQFKATRYW